MLAKILFAVYNVTMQDINIINLSSTIKKLKCIFSKWKYK